jgi:preprotein translocase subunit SecD
LKQGLTLLVLVVLAGLTGWYSLENERFPIARGLDLQGGLRVSLEPDPTRLEPGQTVSDEDMGRVRGVLENRVNSFGLSGTEVRVKKTVDGKQQILITLPGVKDPKKALDTLVTVAQLEFRHLKDVQSTRNPGGRYKMETNPGNPAKGEPETYTFTDADSNKPVDQKVVLEDAPIIVRGGDLKPVSAAEINPGNAQPYVSFEFNATGGKVFGDFTTANVNEILAVVLDDKIISAPNINEPITGGKGQISGGFTTMLEARLLANLLNSGALPIAMRAAETQQVGATLGQESVNKSVVAGLIGLCLVLGFMLLYYWFPGFLACLALLFYTSLSVAIFKGVPGFIPPIVLDLPGITGFILSVGMAVDANILIFERLKEELRAGKAMHQAIDAGFSRAFSSIIDSNVTTWIVCAILVWLGAPVIKGFAITLAIGVAVSMFTAITVTRTLLHAFNSMEWAHNTNLYALNVSWLYLVFPPARNGALLKVFDKRRIYLGISAALGIVSLLFIAGTPFGYGLKPGIDFTGGTVFETAFRQKGVTEARQEELRAEVAKVLADKGIAEATVSIGYSEEPWTRVALEAQEVDAASQARVRERLERLTEFGYDPGAYTAKVEGKSFKAEALFTNAVTEQQVKDGLNRKADPADGDLVLKGLKVALTPEPHDGRENAIPVAFIQTQHPDPSKFQEVKAALSSIAGGTVLPLTQESSIGPSGAADATLSAFLSILVASLGIVAYLAFRFAIGGLMNGLKFGLCAIVALIHDVGIVVGLFALMGALQGWQVDTLFVTAALTVLGFSVHDTIVVYDRIRESRQHRVKHETLVELNDRSITQTFDRSINTSLTVLLVCGALVFFGGESIRLFNLALLVGIGIGAYSSIFVASPLVVIWERASRAKAGQAEPETSRVTTPAAKPKAAPAPRPAPAVATSGGAAPAADADTAAKSAAGTTVRPKKKRRL